MSEIIIIILNLTFSKGSNVKNKNIQIAAIFNLRPPYLNSFNSIKISYLVIITIIIRLKNINSFLNCWHFFNIWNEAKMKPVTAFGIASINLP